MPIFHVTFSIRSLEQGTLQPDWLRVNILHIFEKGDTSSLSNYRPVSLICILCKFSEHIVAVNAVKHLDENQILFDNQDSFHSKRSRETEFTILIEELHKSL